MGRGRERSRWLPVGSTLVLACALFSTAAQDDIHLTLGFELANGNVTLQWTGAQAPWEVFRSTSPGSVDDPANRLGESSAGTWIDSPPPAGILFYKVNSCGLPPAPQPRGCPTCGCCDTWSIRWDPVPCVTHYVVRWGCGTTTQEWNVGNVTSVADLCKDVGMCAQCSFGVSYLRVAACNASGCSMATDVPANERPAACGGGCCC